MESAKACFKIRVSGAFAGKVRIVDIRVRASREVDDKEGLGARRRLIQF